MGGMEIMSTKDAAKYLKVSERTVFRLIKKNAIEASKFGNYWMIDKTSVEDYAKRNKGKAAHDPTRG